MDERELNISQDQQSSLFETRALSSLFSVFLELELEMRLKHLEMLLAWPGIDLCWDIDIELAAYLHQTSEAQYAYGIYTRPDILRMKSRSSMLSGSKKRKRDLYSSLLSDAEDDIVGNFEAEMVKVCRRKLNKDEMEDMELTTSPGRKMMGMKASHLLTELIGSIKEVDTQWLFQSSLRSRHLHVQRIGKEASLETDEAKWLPLELTESNKSTLQYVEFGYVSPIPWVRTDALGRLSCLDVYSFGPLNLETQLYAKANYRMEYKIFQGLEQALKSTAWGKTPDYLESIANRIEQARGKGTDVFHIPVQVLVCAAIKEMEDLPVESLDWDTLGKWGATLKYAEEFGFRVGFADNLLKTNLLAYLAYSTMVG